MFDRIEGDIIMKRAILKRLSAAALAMVMAIAFAPITARADDSCTHDWQQSDQIIQKGDADHHLVRTYYECSLCGDVKSQL